MSFLVAPAGADGDDTALRTLASALCQAQTALQAQGSPLLRGLPRGQQPPVGWPYLISPVQGADCPAEPLAATQAPVTRKP
jgi:hypothetical protein